MSTYANMYIRIEDNFYPIGSLSRNDTLGYILVRDFPWEKIRKIEELTIKEYINYLEDKIDSFEKSIKEICEAKNDCLKYCKTMEEKYEAISHYNAEKGEYRYEIIEYRIAIGRLYSLQTLIWDNKYEKDSKFKGIYIGVEIGKPTVKDVVE